MADGLSENKVAEATPDQNLVEDSPSELDAYLRAAEARIRAYYDGLASQYERWINRYKYYYSRKVKILNHLIPQPGRVLEIGCGVGQNLAGPPAARNDRRRAGTRAAGP